MSRWASSNVTSSRIARCLALPVGNISVSRVELVSRRLYGCMLCATRRFDPIVRHDLSCQGDVSPSVNALYDRFLIVITHSCPSSPTAFVTAATACAKPSFPCPLTIEPPQRFPSLKRIVGPPVEDPYRVEARCSGLDRPAYWRAHSRLAPWQHDDDRLIREGRLACKQ